MLLLTLSPGFATAQETVPPDFAPLLKQHLARYPAMELQDCYKLLVQACLGSEHAVGDPAAAARWMERELATMGPGPNEPLIDPISPDGRIVRVHLRPLIGRQGDSARLVAAFVQTAATFTGSRETLAAAWPQVVALAATGALPFSADAARDYGQKMADADWPAVSHSATFKARYQPAYRVIAREHLAAVLPPQP